MAVGGVPRCAVSIRSRPEGRERARTEIWPSRLTLCFNPLPTRRPGERSVNLNEEGEEPFQSAPDPKAGRESS